MAPELLDSSDRYPPADIFSLGLTLYESCSLVRNRDRIVQGLSSLPSEGPDWHTLRHGEVRTTNSSFRSSFLSLFDSTYLEALLSDFNLLSLFLFSLSLSLSLYVSLSFSPSLFLSLSLSHTHTHTHFLHIHLSPSILLSFCLSYSLFSSIFHLILLFLIGAFFASRIQSSCV